MRTVGGMSISTIFLTLFVTLCVLICEITAQNDTDDPLCSQLLMGQYKCSPPEIDEITQQARGCQETRRVAVTCETAPQLMCRPDAKSDLAFSTFQKDVECKWTNGFHFETSLLLSVFLGMFGIDRFYLGYPAIGLLKFSTLGFFFLGQLVDVLLIATQTVKPSDGSDYVIDFFGAGLEKLSMNNETFFKSPYYT